MTDSLDVMSERMAGQAVLDAERWRAHTEKHADLAAQLTKSQREANEWRGTLADLRGNFLTRVEYLSEHKALEAQFAGLVTALETKVDAMERRITVNSTDIKTANTEALAARRVLSDGRSVLATGGIVFGIIASILLLIDRLPK